MSRFNSRAFYRLPCTAGVYRVPISFAEVPTGAVFNGDAGGHLYAIQFANGVVKLGRADNPRNRLLDHARTAHCYCTRVEHLWVSDALMDPRPHEHAWLGWAREHCESALAHEYFADLNFTSAVSVARSFPYDHVVWPAPGVDLLKQFAPPGASRDVPLLFKAEDIAEQLSVTPAIARKLMASGELPVRRVGRTLMVRRDDVAQYHALMRAHLAEAAS